MLGWITITRRYGACPACGTRSYPRDAVLGLGQDSQSPGVRRLASRFGALLPFVPAAAALREAAGIQLSPSSVRTVTQAVGAAREQAMQDAITSAWAQGWTEVAEAPPDRCYVAMDGVRILGTGGEGREVKVGRVVPVRDTPQGEQPGASRYAAGLDPADAFGRRLAVVPHTVGAVTAARLAVLGDGAAWIWNLAEEHFPQAV